MAKIGAMSDKSVPFEDAQKIFNILQLSTL